MIDMIPNRPLSTHLSRAVDTVDHAQDQLHAVRIHDVTRLIRDVFPQAASIVIDARNRYVDPVGVQLHSIYSRDDQLWSAEDRVPDSLTSYRTADDHGWDDVVAHLEHELTSAIGPEQPHMYWEPYDDDRPDDGLFVTRLPSVEDVSAVETVAPGHLAARMYDRRPRAPWRLPEGPAFWLARPVRYPTMAVGGVEIIASIADDGTFTVDVDTSGTSTADTSEGRLAVDVRLNGSSLTNPADSSS
ncbi:hypothetical protein [Saccharopolyspora taberi]|uniref:Uncharacterized protein n=1 Tax=Saccharopolyspora taberi TaxID=60895 RepID=A0ABN3VNC3_9PSEU